MKTNLTLHLPMTKRNLYTYQLLGKIQSLQKRTNSKYPTPFYQLNLSCLNEPSIKKIFIFHSKLTNLTLWNCLITNNLLGKTYLFKCRNYRGSYYLLDWEEKEVKHD